MKNLFLILTILTISFSCKKQPKMITEPEPIKTSKSFSTKITFTSDSLCDTFNPIPGYYPSSNSYKHLLHMTLDTVNYIRNNNIKQAYMYIAGYGPITTLIMQTTNGSPISITSNDLNKPFTYYINVKEQLYKANGSIAFYTYSKQYTFHEGDNGTINFNTLP